MKREFIRFSEAVQHVGDRETLRQKLVMREIRAYIELNLEDAVYFEDEDEKLKSGRSRFASWQRMSEWPEDVFDPDLRDGELVEPVREPNEIPVRLSGWYMVSSSVIESIARHQEIGKQRWAMSLFPANENDLNDGNIATSPNYFDAWPVFGLHDLWFRPDDVISGKESESSAKGSSRDTLQRLADRATASKERDEQEAPLHKPDWRHWNNMATVRVHDAIVLSCDIDPSWHGSRATIDSVRRRKEIVDAHIKSQTLSVQGDDSQYGERKVLLATFRQWGESLPFPFAFPEEFPKSQVERVTHEAQPSEQARPTKIRSDREESLLRVIAGLRELAELPEPHATAADRISALISGWGWDKPSVQTIAETILREAAKLPRNKDRN